MVDYIININCQNFALKTNSVRTNANRTNVMSPQGCPLFGISFEFRQVRHFAQNDANWTFHLMNLK
jgi:hypothetical protein